MNTKVINEKLRELRVMPVIAIENANDAVGLAKVLVENGLPAAEITFRTESAEESIRLMRKAYPKMLICAGTILNGKQAEAAIKAGADFVVSPAFNENTVRYCLDTGIPIIAGVNSPYQVEKALELGISSLKFFPAEASGGVAMLKSLTGPYKGVEYMPTGGIDVNNIEKYLSIQEVTCCGGTWIAPTNLIADNEWEVIAANVREVVALVKSNKESLVLG